MTQSPVQEGAQESGDGLGARTARLDNAEAVLRDNVELAHRAYDAVNRRDVDAFLGLMDDDVEVVAAMEGNYHGHDEVRRWWDTLLGAIPNLTIEVGAVRDLGNVTLAALRFRGRGAGSGTPFEQLRWNAVRWRRGKCIWWRTFETEAEALDAVRSSE